MAFSDSTSVRAASMPCGSDDGGVIVDAAVADSGFDPAATARAFVERGEHDALVATGYGRHSAREAFGCEVVTEIKAYATGAAALFPRRCSVLDIGGQDTKVISLGASGKVTDFEMNDKCAAGTGKFLEVMARALGFSLEEMAARRDRRRADGRDLLDVHGLRRERGHRTCAPRRGSRSAIARGLHESIAKRTVSSLERVGATGPLVFAGGVAKNPAMVALIREGFSGEVVVPGDEGTDSQILGALGAALCGVARANAVE